MATSKARLLATEYGYSTVTDMCNEYVFESIVPGICMNEGCDASYEYEPCQRSGWCECCETYSVESILSIMNLI